MTIQAQVDGVTITRDLPPEASVMEFVGDGRDQPCADGRCLRCLVLLGDRVVHACRVPAYRAHNGNVTTAAALDSRPEYRDILRAFRRVGLGTCAEAHPYLVFLAIHHLSEGPSPGTGETGLLSRHINDRCSNRTDFERALRIAAGMRRRRTHERPARR